MGCSGSSAIQIQKDGVNLNTEIKEGIEKQEINLKDETDIKIFSAMFVNENKGKYIDFYKPLQTLGKGSFGTVYKVQHRTSGNIYAMKVISKKKTFTEDKNVLREILILRKLDHPNILKIYEYFSNNKNYYFIMEYAPGGELYRQIKSLNNYDEHSAAIIMKQVFSSVSYLHQMNIVHRDIKPENMMLVSEENMNIKLIDFGTAIQLNEGEYLSLKIGSPYYVAPEVLNGRYGKECDLWSCGVLLYILLVGYPPFDGETNKIVYKKIKKGEYSLTDYNWENISNSAKDLIKQLLVSNPQERITAKDALKHPWILNNEEKIDNSLPKLSLKKYIYNFNSKQKLHQASIAFIVHQMQSNNMVQKLTEIFKEIDKSGEGLLSREELKEGYHKYFEENLTDEEFIEIMKTIDQDNSGQISIEEFLRATIDYNKIITEKNLKYAFNAFDKDQSGFLSPDEIKEVLGIQDENENSNKILNEMINDIDLNKDGKISFDEFKLMMTKKIDSNN